MAKHTIAIKALSRFIQLLDSSFPAGAFVHSFGLEPHVVLNKVQTVAELDNYFANLLIDQYLKLEFNFVKEFFILLTEGQLNTLIKADEKFSAMLNYEFAQASENIGHNYLKHINFAIKSTLVKDYFTAVNEHQSVGNELAVLSAYAFELGLDCQTFLLLWAKKSLLSIAGTALKISRIKPSEIQQLLFTYDEKLSKYIDNNETEIMNFNPLFEQVIYQHMHLEPKLFKT